MIGRTLSTRHRPHRARANEEPSAKETIKAEATCKTNIGDGELWEPSVVSTMKWRPNVESNHFGRPSERMHGLDHPISGVAWEPVTSLIEAAENIAVAVCRELASLCSRNEEHARIGESEHASS